MIPVTFLIGFYVTQVVTRYWDQFMSLPYTDILALKLVSFMPGHVGAEKRTQVATTVIELATHSFQDDFHRNLRRTVMRYVNLSIVLVFRLVSRKVHTRFPNYEKLIEAKLMREEEAERMRRVDDKTPHESTWQVTDKKSHLTQ